ncbi:hypothetical protein, partial [Pseudomonas sp. PA-3-6H]|uniref:hypothetical protein n=1 Tax=Pseudomonas sp. PA-3-6H TaxID=2665475 RepID=UPI001F249852
IYPRVIQPLEFTDVQVEGVFWGRGELLLCPVSERPLLKQFSGTSIKFVEHHGCVPYHSIGIISLFLKKLVLKAG